MWSPLVVCLALSLAVVVRGDSQSYLHDPSHVHNKEHIKEHMQEYMGEEGAESLKLDSSEAMEFHYFKLHDYDGNNKLDGLELAAAMTHFHESGPNGKHQAVQIGDEELAQLVEQILNDDDLNDDGYVDYYEFIRAQRRNSNPPGSM